MLDLLRGGIVLSLMGGLRYFSGVILMPYLQTLEIKLHIV